MSLDKTHRIAQNTIMLYIRMLLIIVVTLYTSRIILNTLGVEDYGIYNVVSGVIVMLSFLNSSLGGAGARFIAFTLGKGKQDELKRIFSTVLCVHFILAGGIFIMGETVGLWFVLHKLVIPVERLTAALWVYHCSILTTVVAIISVPYNSLIIAHERMGAFAYISIIEVILKLFVVGLLVYIPYDKLIVYAILYLVVQVIIRLIYNYYCFTHFPESKTPLKWYPHLLKKIAVYAGWTINGNLAVIGYTQGINILLNLFFWSGSQCCAWNCCSSASRSNDFCTEFPDGNQAADYKVVCHIRFRIHADVGYRIVKIWLVFDVDTGFPYILMYKISVKYLVRNCTGVYSEFCVYNVIDRTFGTIT